MKARVIGIALLLAAIAGLTYLGAPGKSQPAEASLMPALAARLDAATALQISSLADPASRMHIVKTGDGWRVQELSGFPADFEQVAGLLDTLAKLRIAEVKTARAEHHARLGLSAEGDNPGTLVEVVFPEDSQALIVGQRSGTRGSFVRHPEASQVYLVQPPVRVATEVMEWVNDIIYNVDSSAVRKVTISHQDGRVLMAARDQETGELQLPALPGGSELQYPTIVDGLARLLTNPRFQAVQPYFAPAFEAATLTEFELQTGEIIQARTVRLGEEYWLHLDTDATSAWQYRVSEYTFNEFNKALEDMLKGPDDNE